MTNQTEARKQLATSACGGSTLLSKESIYVLPHKLLTAQRGGDRGPASKPAGSPLSGSPTTPPPRTAPIAPTPQQPIEFFHEFSPPTVTAQKRRHTSRGTYQTPAIQKAAATWQAVFEMYAPAAPMSGPLRVWAAVTYPPPVCRRQNGVSAKMTKPDCDNLAKLMLDAATRAGYWEDDMQIADLHILKFEGQIPGLAFRLEQWRAEP